MNLLLLPKRQIESALGVDGPRVQEQASPDQRYTHRRADEKAQIAPIVEKLLMVEIHSPNGRGQLAIDAAPAQRNLDRARQADCVIAENGELGVLGFVCSRAEDGGPQRRVERSAGPLVGKAGVDTCGSVG